MNLNLAGEYVLANSINCSATSTWNAGEGFEPIGTSVAPFQGSFDGKGYEISGLLINRPTISYVGLFGYTGAEAHIQTVNLTGGSVYGSSYIGVLVGSNSGAINNAYASSVVAGSTRVGGLVGSNSGAISNAYASSAVTGSGRIGGLVGSNSGDLSNVYATGSVAGGFGSYVGGLVGYNEGSIVNVYASAGVSGFIIGGLLGFSDGGLLSNGYWDTQVSGQSTSAGGGGAVGKITAEMYQQATFQGWDFHCVWIINEGVSYPELTFADCSNRTLTVMTCIELQEAVAAAGATIILAEDIDCADTVNWNGGAGFLPGTALVMKGAFWGQGYSISELVIDRPSIPFVGLFASTGVLAQVDAVTLLGGSVSGDEYVGRLVGWNFGTLSNVYSTGNVTGSNRVGGLVGYNGGTLSNVYAIGNVMGSAYVGGLLGYNNQGVLSNITASGSVSSSGSYIGGLLGYNHQGTLSKAYASGNVRSSGSYIGGLLGYNDQGTLSKVYATGNVMGSAYVGGLLGYNSQGVLNNITASGSVMGSSNNIGGLLGYNDQGTLSNAYASGSVSSSGSYIGGLLGYNKQGTLSNAYATGSATGSGNYVGGLVGRNTGFLINAYASGNATAVSFVAGLVAQNTGFVINVYASGNVTGSPNFFGGLVGIGGLIGSNTGILNYAYWDTQTSGQSASAGGAGAVGRSTTQMYQQATFQGFDFSCAWTINESAGYPELTFADCASWTITVMTCIELQEAVALPGGTIILGQDIDCVDTANWNGGAGFLPGTGLAITGAFLGQGYSISGLVIDRTTISYLGLFVSIGALAQVDAVTLLDGSVSGNEYVGSLVGKSSGTISNVYVRSNVTGSGDYIGGLVGYNNLAPINNVTVSGNVTASGRYVGGLAGYNYGGTLSNVYVSGNIAGSERIGGLVGSNSGTLNNVTATACVIGSADYVGGLLGYNSGFLTNAYSSGSVVSSGNYVAGLLGYNTGFLSNAYVSASVEALGDHVGGLLGFNTGTFENVSVTGSVMGSSAVGGLLGSNNIDGFIFSNIYASADVSGSTNYVGGLLGFNSADSVVFDNIYTTGNLSGSANYIGGLLGFNSGDGVVFDNIYTTGNFSGSANYVGGLLGSNMGTNVVFRNVYASGNVESSGHYVGGFLGENRQGSLTNVTASGDVRGDSYVGGLIGWNNGILINTTAQGNVFGKQYVGGLIGANEKVSIRHLHATGAVSAISAGGRYFGGLLGFNIGSVTDCYALGAVSGQNFVGGLIGAHDYELDEFEIALERCFAAGDVTGNYSVGGLVGKNRVTVTQSFATGAVSGNSTVGGLMGHHLTILENTYATGPVSADHIAGGLVGLNDGIVSASYAIGNVAANTHAGGLVGQGSGFVQDAYWDIQTSAQTTSAGGVGRISQVMRAQNNYEAWDSATVWRFPCQNYPQLQVWSNAPDNNTNVFWVSTCEALGEVCLDADVSVYLTQDIDCSDTANWNNGKGFLPLGWFQDASLTGPFAGYFDGQGYAISGLTINRPDEDYIGLFGYTAQTTVIGNVSLINVNVNGGRYTGALVGWNNGRVAYTHVTGQVTATDAIAGGLIGWQEGVLRNSASSVNVQGVNLLGGLVGWNQNQIIACYAASPVQGSENLGGLVGFSSTGATTTHSYWDVDISGQTASAGGQGRSTQLMQWQANYATWDFIHTWWLGCQRYPQLRRLAPIEATESVVNVTDCLSLQSVCPNATAYLSQDIDCMETENWNDGKGFLPLGWYQDADTFEPFSGVFDGQGYRIRSLYMNQPDKTRLGLFGYTAATAEIRNVILEEVNIHGQEIIGGLVGYHQGSVSHCQVTGSVSLTVAIGAGLLGVNQGEVSNSHFTGQVDGIDTVAGLIAENTGTVTDCSASAVVNGNFTVAGLIARNQGEVSSCHSKADVTALEEAGGLIADHSGTLIFSHSNSSVTAQDTAGGLVGRNSGDILSSYALGEVAAAQTAGGLVGHNLGEITQCFAQSRVIGVRQTGGLIGVHSGELIDSYAVTSTTGEQNVGGLIGQNSGRFSNCYVSGCVQGNSVGALTGSFLDTALVSQSYWDVSTTGQSLPGVNDQYYSYRRRYRRQTQAMYQPNTYQGWDFEQIWQIAKGDSYPYLQFQTSMIPIKPVDACPIPPALYQTQLNSYIGVTAGAAALGFAWLMWRRRQKQAVFHPLHAAAQIGSLSLVKWQIEEKGASVMAEDAEGHTPLWWAAQGGHLEVVAYLVSKMSVQDSLFAFEVALKAAINNGHKGVNQYIPNSEAIEQQYQQQIDEELKAGLSLSLLSEHDLVAAKDHTEINLVNCSGLTPPMLAVCLGDFYEAQKFVGDGADLFVRSPKGYTAIDMAIMQGKRVDAQLLVRASPYYAVWPASFDLFLQAIEENAPQFTHLDLSGQNLTDVQLQKLAQALSNNTVVTEINLARNSLSVVGLRGWLEGPGLPAQLTKLDLSDNLLDVASVRLLMRALQRQTVLRIVELANNELLPQNDVYWNQLNQYLSQRQLGNANEELLQNAPSCSLLNMFGAQLEHIQLRLQRYQLVTVFGFMLEMADRISDAFLIRELLANDEAQLALYSTLFLFASYGIGLWGMRTVRGRWYPKSLSECPYWLLTLPILSPEWVRLEWGVEYIDQRFAKMKIANFSLEDVPQFTIGVLFLTRKGSNTFVLIKVVVAFTASLFFLSKLLFYDLPTMRQQLWQLKGRCFGKQALADKPRAGTLPGDIEMSTL